MVDAGVELEADDGEDDDAEEDEQEDVEERGHGFEDGRKDHLQTGHSGHELQRTQHSERAQDL